MALKIPVNDKDHIQGDPNASIELVEYGDYQCPYCGEAYYEIKELQKKLGKKLKFIFRNFPLTSVHRHALNAAMAAEVAGGLGDFWKMHDLLFENQNALEDDDLIRYAERIGLDTETFKSELGNKKYEEKIDDDLESGLRSGVNGTPSIFINGEKYEGEFSALSLLRYIELELY